MSLARLGRKIVPASLRPKVGKAYHTIRLGVRAAWMGLQKETAERVMLSNPVGRKLHYRLTGAFSREHAAVAAGRMRYRTDLQQARSASYLLRRNTHRIEKGLIMPNRRAVFALDFIEETVAEFEAVVKGFCRQPSDTVLSSELQWASDVIGQYFEVTDPDHPKLSVLKPRFAAVAALLDGRVRAAPRIPGERGFIPFARDLRADTASFEALKSLAMQRRSVRNYRSDPVARNVIDAAVEIAAQSPSACNRQAFSFYIFDDRILREKLQQCRRARGHSSRASRMSQFLWAICGPIRVNGTATPFMSTHPWQRWVLSTVSKHKVSRPVQSTGPTKNQRKA